MPSRKIAISIGDLNGIGIQLALENHESIKQIIDPLYCIDDKMLKQASKLLNIPIPSDFKTVKKIAKEFTIEPAKVSKESGVYSFASFLKAVELSKTGELDGIMTLPIHKKAWELGGVTFKGHTDALREFFFAPAIMMLGSPKMYVALYTEHIPLNQVSAEVKNVEKLSEFLIDFYDNIKNDLKENEQIGLLGLNPHAGDDGVLGNEEIQINEAREIAHQNIGKEVYTMPLVPDVAFTPNSRKKHHYFVAMYHDQGLAPLKALYFDEGINISLNLPIIRTSVDHGTAFDIAYKKFKLNNLSYVNAINYFVTT
ncbi:MAG: 4-hydroxythreonine-4-phosphate dehydrogenase (EC [uncultured Sulfurovum sp.]|uniref:4-hydroxythreonine-4-phosphate dehydrogenase n=1 Tax=uncultured Sulfurovum sp. TaxID=269237 RepID=A0A6S6TPG1_9BACT|nr:MAG: 4-hydroxythreonine-4-phosphate dehydrogenase (EC [uncultured Sulfurovum sp.]